jgi:aspartate carbamoyltransferase catalytic subunit
MRHVVRSQQFDRKTLEELFQLADALEKWPDDCMRGKIMASLFYEPSTRTRFSFESAMMRLGGNVLTTENAKEFSSAAKGETIEDTIRVVNHYADVIVLRHFEEGAAERAAAVSEKPIINAGDGKGQHPTQALLDLYTIARECKKIDAISIGMVGDLKNGRTVRSLSYLLGKYKHVTIHFVSPKELRIGNDIKAYLNRHNVHFAENTKLEDVAARVDVLYQTRIQRERFSDKKEYEKFKGVYVITPKVAQLMKRGAIIMHPLPRVDEILPSVDSSKKAIYFKQARYGLLIRMALLKKLAC